LRQNGRVTPGRWRFSLAAAVRLSAPPLQQLVADDEERDAAPGGIVEIFPDAADQHIVLTDASDGIGK
jgi:hypothetical protein